MLRCKLWMAAVGATLVLGSAAAAQNAVDIKPTPHQTQWQDLEFRVILHFSTNTFLDREWGDGTASPTVFNPTAAAYDAYYQAQLEELVTHYADLMELWLDGAGSGGHVYNFPRIIETLRTYQPNTIVFADTALSSTAMPAGQAHLQFLATG